MFGYITPHICELKVYEYELYRAYYCGLCKALKQQYRRTCVLNYDCTFLSLLGDSLQDAGTEVLVCKCFLHPVQKKGLVHSAAAQYAADVNILMAAAKARDDARDTNKPSARLRLRTLDGVRKKAMDRQPAVTRDMLEMSAALRDMEVRGSANTDETADTYARLFGSVLMALDPRQSHVLYELGYSMGRWVYLIDAYDDIKRDLEHHEYNVFVNKYGITGAVPAEAKREIEFGFHFTLSRATQALGSLELKKNRNILENIIRLGLKEKTRAVMGGYAQAGREPDESIPGAGG